MADEERLQILDMIASGKISAQQGIELLNALDEEAAPASELPAGEVEPLEPPDHPDEVTPLQTIATVADEVPSFDPADPAPEPSETAEQATPERSDNQPESLPFDPRMKKWQGWWRIPLWIGVIATILTGLLMYSIYQAAGFNFWFACSWFPFLISVAILALAWASRSAHWIHIRVRQRPGERPQNIAISFPLPLSLTAWFLRTFRSKIPGIEGVNPDEMIMTLNHVTPDKPFYVEVNEEGGEHVEVYIG